MDSTSTSSWITPRGVAAFFASHLWWFAFAANMLFAGPHDAMNAMDGFLMLAGIAGGPLWPLAFYPFLWKSSRTGKKITIVAIVLVAALYGVYAYSVLTTHPAY